MKKPGAAKVSSNREVEYKLDAPGKAALDAIAAHILSAPHYHPAVQDALAPQGLQLLGKPQEMTDLRVRTYYDVPALTGYKNNVEIRVESKGDHHKMTVKIGGNKPRNGRFSRMEKAIKLSGPTPDLKNLDAQTRKLLCDVFGVKSVGQIKLRPLIEITSQRWRLQYHPAGNKKVIVEYAHDVALARTFTGVSWPLFQAELEIKKGSPKNLAAEEARLLQTFNFLTRGTVSKPSPGFEVLKRQLASEKAQKFVRDRLIPGKFRVFKRPDFNKMS